MLDPADCGPACIALCQDIQGQTFDYPEEFFQRKEFMQLEDLGQMNFKLKKQLRKLNLQKIQ